MSVKFSSVAQSCLILCDPLNRSMPGLPVHHQLPESTQTYVHWVSDAIQPSHPLLSPSPPALNLSQHQGLFKWVSSSYQVAKVLEFQLQCPSREHPGLLSPKKIEIMPFAATWMDRRFILSEVSQAKGNITWYHTWTLKYNTNTVFYKTETDS